MRMEELLEHADYLLRVATGKCDSWEDAQDLVQSALLEGLLAIRKGKKIDNARSWLVTVLNRRYYDMLREKYRKPILFLGVDYDLVRGEDEDDDITGAHGTKCGKESTSAYDMQCGKERATETADGISGFTENEDLTEEENLRRLVARMTKQCREVLIRHYFRGQSVKDIAEKLSLPENTVKSRLRLGRDKLRKDLTMEKYEKQSYEPETLWIAATGTPGLNDEPYSLVKDDKIVMNLLILAYEKPVTLPELADAIGISTTYIEPIVDRLVNGELMKRAGDKVYTDFIIYSEADRISTLEIQKELATKLFDDIWKEVEDGLKILRSAEYYQRQNASARLKLEGYFALRTVYQSVLKARDEVAGHVPVSEYPDRTGGGRWFAMGNRYPADYDYDNCPYDLYNISGEGGGYIQCLPGARSVGLYDYDLDNRVLGKAHTVYHTVGDPSEARECVIKFLYAVYRDDESLLSGISRKTLENVDVFLNLDYLERSPEGKLKLKIPVLSEEDRNAFYGLANEYAEKLLSAFRGEYAKMIKNPVSVPKHVQSDVPDFLRYLNTCCYFPSALILEARNRGRFLVGHDGPVPAVMMFVSKE